MFEWGGGEDSIVYTVSERVSGARGQEDDYKVSRDEERSGGGDKESGRKNEEGGEGQEGGNEDGAIEG